MVVCPAVHHSIAVVSVLAASQSGWAKGGSMTLRSSHWKRCFFSPGVEGSRGMNGQGLRQTWLDIPNYPIDSFKESTGSCARRRKDDQNPSSLGPQEQWLQSDGTESSGPE